MGRGYCERKACAVHDTQTLTVGNQKAGTPAKGMRNERLQKEAKGARKAKGRRHACQR